MVGGGWQWLAVGGWSPLAVGGGRWLTVGGDWRLVAVGGPLGRSLTKKIKNLVSKGTPWGCWLSAVLRCRTLGGIQTMIRNNPGSLTTKSQVTHQYHSTTKKYYTHLPRAVEAVRLDGEGRQVQEAQADEQQAPCGDVVQHLVRGFVQRVGGLGEEDGVQGPHNAAHGRGQHARHDPAPLGGIVARGAANSVALGIRLRWG